MSATFWNKRRREAALLEKAKAQTEAKPAEPVEKPAAKTKKGEVKKNGD